MELKTLVQGKDELDAGKAVEYIEGCEGARLVLIYSSLKNEFINLDYVEKLIENLKTDFIGARVAASVTNQGYNENAISYAILCGDIEHRIYHTKTDYENPHKTAEKIIPELKGYTNCLAYSANYIKENIHVDNIFQQVQKQHPNLQINGGITAPPPIVFDKNGIYEDSIILAALKNKKTDFYIDCGFKLREDSEKYTITKADEKGIKEINHKPAIAEYSRMTHTQPYMMKTVFNISSRLDWAKMTGALSKSNPILQEAIQNIYTNILGKESKTGIVNMMFSQPGENTLIPNNIIPEGSQVKWTATTPQKQLAVYDRFTEKHLKARGVIADDCCIRAFWFNHQLDKMAEKLMKLEYPYIFNHMNSELGTKTPYTHQKENILHGGTLKALVFK